MGLAEDVCVLYTALDARRLGFQTRLVHEGTRAVNAQPGDGERAKQRMLEAGVHMVAADTVAVDDA